MIAAIIRVLLAGLWKPVALIFGGLIARWQIRRGVKMETALQAAERHDKAMQAGRAADAKARADLHAGDTPDGIVRRNDGEWRR